MAKSSIKEIQALTRGVGFGNGGTVELSPEDVAALNVAADKEALPEYEPDRPNESEDKPVPPQIDMDKIQEMISTAIASTNEAHQRELEAIKASHEAALDEVRSLSEAETAQARAELESLQTVISTLGLDKFKGDPQPMQADSTSLSGKMTVEGTGSPESRRYQEMVAIAPSSVVTSQRAGQVRQRDNRAADEYFLNNRDRIRGGLEAEMMAAGFLQGSATTNAITDVADIPSLSFEYLSSVVRQTHFPDLVHWQFANYSLELGTRPGLVIGVPRFDDITRPTAFSDRVLTPGTVINSNTNPILEKNTLITIQELGLGKDASNVVLGLSTFVSAYSLHNLEQIITEKLGRDFHVTKDMGLFEQWFATDRTVYNSGNTVTTTATSGNMSQGFLIALRSYMKSLEIPTYRDNCYGIVMNPNAIAQYMKDKSTKERDDAMAGRDLVGQMLANATGQQFGGEVSGYRGAYDGFHIFEQNVYGIGSNGDAGTVTLNAGLGDSSFAFGPNTIAWAEGLPVEIRLSTDTDFGRQQLMTWYAHAGVGPLNVKNNGTTGEQLRVIEVVTSRETI